MKTLTLLLCAAIALQPIHAATITAIKDGNWTTKGTWDLHRPPDDNDTVVIPSGKAVSIKNTPYAKKNFNKRPLISLHIYGVLDFSDAGSDKLYLDEGSVIQIFAGGTIQTNNNSDEVIAIYNGSDENIVWDGTPATINGIAYATSTSLGFIGTILPLKFASFTIETTANDNIKIEWSTAEEQNTSHFEIQVYDGGHNSWNTVGQVMSKGNARYVNNYSFVLTNALPGKNAFRIKQIDTDGRYTFSEIKQFASDKVIPASIRYDNRSHTIHLTAERLQHESVTVRIFTMNGNLRSVSRLKPGEMSLVLPTSLRGLYVVQVMAGTNRIITKKIVVN